MTLRFLPILFSILLFTASINTLLAKNVEHPNAHLLITAFSLNELIESDSVFIIDMRANGFEDEHIPGAVWFGGSSALVDSEHQIESFLIDSEDFQTLMQSIGVNNDSRIAIYDDGNSLNSARLFFALELYGFGGARILNGGFIAWQAAGLPVSKQPREFTNGNFTTDVKPERTCDVSFLLEVLNSDRRDDYIILDARSPEEFTGESVRAERGGHIPGAVNIEWRNFVEAEGIPFFKSFDEITDLLAAQGITPDKEVVTHCQTNVRGAHAYFTLRLMGYDSVRAYEGSWFEWGNLSDTPID